MNSPWQAYVAIYLLYARQFAQFARRHLSTAILGRIEAQEAQKEGHEQNARAKLLEQSLLNPILFDDQR
ncbi:MAG: hypothetical protein JWO91_3041 [Acidobacteriaceae bacterium]|nr:hypothetical protein [Acidobacteriaceae bacterium]